MKKDKDYKGMMEKWEISDEEMGFMKAFCIHGFRISDVIPVALNYKQDIVSVTLIPYCEFINNYNKDDFINNHDFVDCDIVALVRTCNNNTIEIQILKTIIVSLYFAERYKQSMLLIQQELKKDIPIEGSRFYWHDFLANYSIDGYKTIKNEIQSSSWYVNIGNRSIDIDDFERWSTRIYGSQLMESYDSKAGIPELGIPTIEVDRHFISSLRNILIKINSDSLFGRKLKSVFRLYYEILNDYRNIDYTIISYSTILETLLLKNDESSQRKKVSARAACLACDKLPLKYKKFTADYVYHFYRYRNMIVHDGKGLMDIEDEFLLYRSIWCMKTIVFCIVKYIIDNQINSNKDIIQLVKDNINYDGLKDGFDYIDLRKFENPNYKMIIIIE